MGYAVRTARFRYISYASKGLGTPAGHAWPSAEAASAAGAELYDLADDPAERSNLLRPGNVTRESARAWAVMEAALRRLTRGQSVR